MLRTLQILIFLATVLGTIVVAQEPHPSPDFAPPPLKVIPKLERSQIDETDNAKERVKTTILLADANLQKAESKGSQSDFAGAASAIGIYWALLEDVFAFLKSMKPDSDKTRDLYKRVELTLRAHGPRLVAMRRNTPAEYAVWIKQLEEFARNGRTEALNSFYGHTVFREPAAKPTPQKENPQPQKALNATEVKKP